MPQIPEFAKISALERVAVLDARAKKRDAFGNLLVRLCQILPGGLVDILPALKDGDSYGVQHKAV
jgi:hypothetical protein